MPAERTIPVEVVYALPAQAHRVSLQVPAGTSLQEAVRLSGLLERFPGIQLCAGHVGIYGRPCSPERILRAGDRVELYRPLTQDAKQARRTRAAQGGGN